MHVELCCAYPQTDHSLAAMIELVIVRIVGPSAHIKLT